MLRNRIHARQHPHVESYGSNPVIVYAPQGDTHGNFYPPAYSVIRTSTEWIHRFNKIHSHGRSLPKPQLDPHRRWRELDSSMSSDALLMNVFCTPGVLDSIEVQRTLGIDPAVEPIFGWKARVPLRNGRFDRTEVDLRWGNLLLESKLTETDFQCRAAFVVESYRDLDAVFDTELLPRVSIRTARRRAAAEFAEVFTQEWEEPREGAAEVAQAYHAEIEEQADLQHPWQPGYAGYQLIRNVLAAYAAGASFCVVHDQRRPDLREAWFEVLRSVKTVEMRSRCKVITWQELAPLLPSGLRDFLDLKYGIVAPGATPSLIPGLEPG